MYPRIPGEFQRTQRTREKVKMLSCSNDGLSELLCPRCGEANLHQGRVMVLDPIEDEEVTVVTVVDGGLSATYPLPSKEVSNPSDRRDGIVIDFGCENCRGALELTIAQHKGATHVVWLVGPKESDTRNRTTLIRS
jgi:hypothetical protein